MTFAEKVRTLRIKKGWTQPELALQAGVSLRTILNWEVEGRLPRYRSMYKKLADLFGVEETYLFSENEEFILNARSKYGTRGRQQAEQLVSQLGGMFAGGELSDADKQAVFEALQEAYWDAKLANKKYTPKKYRDEKKSD